MWLQGNIFSSSYWFHEAFGKKSFRGQFLGWNFSSTRGQMMQSPKLEDRNSTEEISNVSDYHVACCSIIALFLKPVFLPSELTPGVSSLRN